MGIRVPLVVLGAAVLVTACDSSGESEIFADAGDGGGDCLESETADVPACPIVIGVQSPCEGRAHVAIDTDIRWQTNPPASGPHFGLWERDKGEHADPVARGNWVHNLEHGWVVLLHNCPTACEPELDVLRAVLAQRPDSRIVMTPDPLLDPARFAAVSWTFIYETDAPDLDTLLCFVDQHERQAPEDVP